MSLLFTASPNHKKHRSGNTITKQGYSSQTNKHTHTHTHTHTLHTHTLHTHTHTTYTHTHTLHTHTQHTHTHTHPSNTHTHTHTPNPQGGDKLGCTFVGGDQGLISPSAMLLHGTNSPRLTLDVS